MGAEDGVMVCHGHKHGGAPCDRPAAPGKPVCTWHGGAPGVGAPRGNRNAWKHGWRSRQWRTPRARLDVSNQVHGLEYEIAYLRALVEKAMADGADIDTIGKGMILLARLTRVDARLRKKSDRDRPAIVADVIQRLGGQMGLWELMS